MLTLYSDLMKLCETNEAFYFVDHVYADRTYRIFTYRLASYSDFLLPGALECRGHTFLLPDPVLYGPDMPNYAQVMPNLVSLPMEKFFNVGENPMTMDLDWSRVVRIDDKLDGSLISTVWTPDGFILKSKGSLSSVQARAASALLLTDAYADLHEICRVYSDAGYTVNMEYTAPDNQIVLGYKTAQLRILNIRYNIDGSYLELHELPEQWVVPSLPFEEVTGQMIDDFRLLTGIEGYVLWFPDGMKVKLKTDWYCNLHLQKEQVTNPRRLFESVIMEQSDDLKALFLEDPESIARIIEMEVKGKALYNRLHKAVEAFYLDNKELSRKDYAIKGQADLKADGVFSLAMNLYIGRDMGLKEHLVKNYKSYGIVDTTNEAE